MLPHHDQPLDLPAPAIVCDMTMEDYQKRTEALSKSMICELECPRKFQWQYIENQPAPDEDYLNVGAAVHTLALEPALFKSRFHVLPATYKNADDKELPFKRDKRMAVYKEQIAIAAGRSILTAGDYADIEGMANSLARDNTAVALLKRTGVVEASIFWSEEIELVHPETGAPIKSTQRYKCRPDFLSDDNLVVDLKTAATVKPAMFHKNAFDNHYDLSVALTSRGIRALRGKMPDNYVFIAIEKEAPFVVECFDAYRPWSPDDVAPLSYYDAGAHRLDIYLARHRQCVSTGRWPGYNGGKIMPMSVPGYALKQLDKEAA